MKAKLTSLILIVHAQRNAKNVTAPGDQIGFAQILPPLLCWRRSKICGQETLLRVTGAGGGDPGGDGTGGSAKTTSQPVPPRSSPLSPVPSAAPSLPSLQGFSFPSASAILLLLLIEICWWHLPASCRYSVLEQKGSTTGNCINLSKYIYSVHEALKLQEHIKGQGSGYWRSARARRGEWCRLRCIPELSCQTLGSPWGLTPTSPRWPCHPSASPLPDPHPRAAFSAPPVPYQRTPRLTASG